MILKLTITPAIFSSHSKTQNTKVFFFQTKKNEKQQVGTHTHQQHRLISQPLIKNQMSLNKVGLEGLSTDAFLLIVSFVSGDRIHLLQSHRRFWVYRFRVLWFIYDQKLPIEVPSEVLQLRTPVALRLWPESLRTLICNVGFISDVHDVCRHSPSSLINLEFYNIDREINCTLLPFKLQTLCFRLMNSLPMQSIDLSHLLDLRELTLEGRIFRLITFSPVLERFTWTADCDDICGNHSLAEMLFPNRNIFQMSTSLTYIDIASDVVFQHLNLPQSLVFFRLHSEKFIMNAWPTLCHLQTLIMNSTLNHIFAKDLPLTLTCLHQSQYLVQSLDLLHLTSLRVLGLYIEKPTSRTTPSILVQLPNCLETLITSPSCVEHFSNLDTVRNLRIRSKDTSLWMKFPQSSHGLKIFALCHISFSRVQK
jgi:hypothetical protein